MKYTGYQVSKTSQENVFLAYKHDAKRVYGIRFSHHFYFTYCADSDVKIDDKSIIPFEPSFNDNYFQANANTGVVLSKDMKTFAFQDSSLDFTNYALISLAELSKLEYEN